MTASPISISDLFTMQNMGMQPPPQYAANAMGMPISQMPAQAPQQTPMSGPQNVQMPSDIQHIQNVVNQYQQNQSGQDTNQFLQQILSNRMQPTAQDAARATSDTAMAIGMPDVFKAQNPDQAMQARIASQLAPYTEAVGLQGKQAEAGLQSAQAGYYNSALQRAIAEKKYQYENDPQMALMRSLANYMQPGAGQSASSSPPVSVNGVASMPGQLPSGSLPNAMPSSNTGQQGFDLRGAMLAKMAGLTDMQLTPNGQGGLTAGPVPGFTKIENGNVVTFGADGKPTMTVPKNPVASQNIEDTAQYLLNKIDELKSSGNAVSERQPFYQNAINKLGNTGVGLSMQPGSKAASIIAEMAKYTMQAMPDYMAAKGITPGMERTIEGQKMILNAVGVDPTANIEAGIEGIKNLSKIAGTGQIYRTSAIQDAKDAIAKGANPDAVIQRLNQMGIK